jgi:general secretion pathway protein N
MAGREVMLRRVKTLLWLAVVLGTAAPSLAANPPNVLDVAPPGVTPPTVDMLQTAPVQQSTSERTRELSENPLWAIPLSTLSATRERPLFTPSRRPPAPAVAGPPRAEPVAAAPTPAAEPERPQLFLVGAVGAESGGIAIFVNQATNDIVRLRTGDSYSGWMLRSVKGREAMFQKNNETLVLVLPAPGSAAPAGAPPGVPGAPGKEPEL